MTETTVELANRHSTAKRVVLGLAGLVVAIFPLRDLWPGFASLSMVSPIYWIIGIGAAGIGLILVAAALFGPSTVLSVGPDGIVLTRDSPIGKRRRELTPDELGPIQIEQHEWSEGPATWGLTVALKVDKSLASEDFPERAGAEQLASRLAETLQRFVP